MAISTDNVLDAMNMAGFVGADPRIGVRDGIPHPRRRRNQRDPREYGVFDLHADGVAAPATFILDKSGEVVAYHVSQGRHRPSDDRSRSSCSLDQMSP